MVYKFLIKKRWRVKNENSSNKELGKKLYKPLTINFNERKVHSPLIDNIWGADLANMQLISKLNKGFRFLKFVIPLKDKKGITITNAFQRILKESNRKPNKIWVDMV